MVKCVQMSLRQDLIPKRKVLGVLRDSCLSPVNHLGYISSAPKIIPMWKRTTSSKGHRWKLSYLITTSATLSSKVQREQEDLLASLSLCPSQFQRGLYKKEKRRQLSL